MKLQTRENMDTSAFHSTPLGGFGKLISYADKKVKLSWGRLIGHSIAAGWWAAMGGHIASVFASTFYYPDVPFSGGFSRFAYGMIFPIAFMAITFTGSELFTGNTVAMTVCALHRPHRKTWIALLKNWSVVLAFNYAGAVLGAAILSKASNVFSPSNEQAHEYFGSICAKKLGYSFVAAMVHGIGCNILVCLATFLCVMIKEAIGKIFIMWFLVAAFVYAGFEHIVANFYTLSVCNFYSQYNVSYGNTWLHNFFPVLLGNVLGGALICGGTWFLTLHSDSDTNGTTDVQLGEASPASPVSRLASHLASRARSAAPRRTDKPSASRSLAAPRLDEKVPMQVRRMTSPDLIFSPYTSPDVVFSPGC